MLACAGGGDTSLRQADFVGVVDHRLQVYQLPQLFRGPAFTSLSSVFNWAQYYHEPK